MKKLFKFLGISTLSLILLSSCDCVVNHKGFVLDELTNQPIPNAKILFDKREFTSDSDGYFEIGYVTGFCPDEKYFITKPDYRDYELSIERTKESVSYEVYERNQDLERGYSNSNSNSFEVRNDTLYFYLESKNGL